MEVINVRLLPDVFYKWKCYTCLETSLKGLNPYAQWTRLSLGCSGGAGRWCSERACRWRDADHIPAAHVFGCTSCRCKCDQYCRVVSRLFRRNSRTVE